MMSSRKGGRWIVVLVVFAMIAGIPFLQPVEPVGAAQTWNYTALGDSLAFGALALPFRGYSFLFREAVQSDTQNTVLIYNLGVLGWKSSDLLQSLRSSWFLRTAVYFSQVVTWDIGGNELSSARNQYKDGTCGGTDNQECLRATVAQFKLNWDAILSELLELRNFNRTIARTMDIYNPFVSEDQATDSWPSDAGSDFVVLKPYLEDVNGYIAKSAAANGIGVASVYAAFNGMSGNEDPKLKGYISFDGFHPNDKGHAVIAQLLRGLGYSPLQ
jgi:lysophospholipase L1-like esterase